MREPATRVLGRLGGESAPLLALCAVIVLSGAPPPAAAVDHPKTVVESTSKAVALTRVYHWYDGDRVRRIWLNPSLVAEFHPAPEQLAPLPSRAATTPRVRWHSPFVRIVEQPFTARAGTPAATAPASPVFHDRPTSLSPLRALPGGVVIYLPAHWSGRQVDDWLTDRDLVRLRTIPLPGNVLLVDSEPGLAALELANTLHESGQVLAAFPDWWRPGVAK